MSPPSPTGNHYEGDLCRSRGRAVPSRTERARLLVGGSRLLEEDAGGLGSYDGTRRALEETFQLVRPQMAKGRSRRWRPARRVRLRVSVRLLLLLSILLTLLLLLLLLLL